MMYLEKNQNIKNSSKDDRKSGKSIPQMSDDEKKGHSSIRFKQVWKGRGKKNEELNSSEIGKGDNRSPSKDVSDSSNIK